MNTCTGYIQIHFLTGKLSGQEDIITNIDIINCVA